jgi:hypothetical protein
LQVCPKRTTQLEAASEHHLVCGPPAWHRSRATKVQTMYVLDWSVYDTSKNHTWHQLHQHSENSISCPGQLTVTSRIKVVQINSNMYDLSDILTRAPT